MRATKLELTDSAGDRHELIVESATGTTAHPLTSEQVRAKASRLLAYVSTDASSASDVVDALYRLPEPGSLMGVMDALSADRTMHADRYGF